MKSRILVLLSAIILFAALGTVQTFSQKIQDQFITFDVPGAGPIGTNPTSINPSDTITGFYVGADNVSHGFVRDKDGTITMFDVAGASPVASAATVATSINPRGDITGWYNDVSRIRAQLRLPESARFRDEITRCTQGVTTSGVVLNHGGQARL